MASDQGVLKYGFKADVLASALFKVTKKAKMSNKEMLCSFSDKKSTSMIRLQAILGIQNSSIDDFIIPKSVGITLLAIIMALCAFRL